MFSELERRHGIHGGEIETSLMLHFRPDLVDMSESGEFRLARRARRKRRSSTSAPTGTHAFAWIASDLNPAGTVGNAAAATAEKGRAVAEHQARGFIALLQDVRAVPLGEGFGTF